VELALACALYSARAALALPPGLAIAGELSLTGELRPVNRLAGRIKTSRSLGFDTFLGPPGETPSKQDDAPQETGTGFKAARNIKSAIKEIYG
jgi:DNA repair protein RadA/Sms